GISGTNAHLILEQPPAADETPAEAPEPLPWLISAKTETALRAQAARLRDLTADSADVAYALATTRTAFAHRAAITATQPAELSEALQALADGRPAPGLLKPEGRPGRTAFVFSGQGAQVPGMGRELYARYPVFAETFDEALSQLDPELR